MKSLDNADFLKISLNNSVQCEISFQSIDRIGMKILIETRLISGHAIDFS